jgi:hypothetical protein
MFLLATAICLIACHGGPADHFATFAEKLVDDGYEVQVYASGPALKKFKDHNIKVLMPFNLDNLSTSQEAELASQIAKSCSKALVVLTDVGHTFDITLQKALAVEAPDVVRLAYYDNAEPFVPGGYSSVAADVMLAAQKVLFANANLESDSLYQQTNVETKLSFKERVGLGYYPLAQAEKTAARRLVSHDAMRAQLLAKHGLEEKGQKVLVYFGGNNEEYFTKALPAFLTFFSEGIKHAAMSNIVIVMQQHPGAKVKNIDGQQIEAWFKEQGITALKMIISDETSDDVQVFADGALYYQTSMGPQFALAGIPMVQVGHQTFEDVLVRGGICPSVTCASDFVKAIEEIKPVTVSVDQRKIIYQNLGIKENWYQILKQSLTNTKK